MNLYPFQEDGVAWLMHVKRGILGYEPGLGKTCTSIRAVRGLRALPCLVVCTNTMRWTWAREVETWWPGLKVVVLDKSSARRTKQLQEPADVTIVNWESLRTLSRLAGYGSIALKDNEKVPGPLNRPWGAVIADEIHMAKDPRAKQTRAYWAIMSTAECRFGLTGTLTPESPENAWAPMHGIAPEEYPSRTQFIERYCSTIAPFWGGLEVLGLKDETKDEFFGFFDPRFLRRTKAQALPQLPEKTYTTRYLTMEPKQRRAYDDLERKFLANTDGGVLVATGSLPQHVRLLQSASATPLSDGENVSLIAPSNKVNALLDLISESPNEPLVVFSPSKKLIKLCGESLEKARITFSYITGDEPTEVRQQAVNDFQSGAVQVVLGTTQAGGTGITLHRAQRLVFLSRPEASVQSIQAEDRVHRIGQTGIVEIIDFVSLDTVEHDVHENLGRKGELAQQVNRDPAYIRRLILERKDANAALCKTSA